MGWHQLVVFVEEWGTKYIARVFQYGSLCIVSNNLMTSELEGSLEWTPREEESRCGGLFIPLDE